MNRLEIFNALEPILMTYTDIKKDFDENTKLSFSQDNLICIIKIEESFGVELSDDEIDSVKNVSDLISILEKF